MIEDLTRYNKNLKDSICRIYLDRDEIRRKKILEISDPVSVPCIIIVLWIGELEGYPDWLKYKYDYLMKTYGYNEIKGKPEGCPW